MLSKGSVFLTGVEDERLLTYAVDRETGLTLWKSEAPRPRRTKLHPKNHAAAASAAVDGDTVVVFFDEYGLLAYDHEGGERWRLPLGPFDNVYGMAASPILVGDVVVLACDQSTGSFVVGVDKYSGDERWRTSRPRAVSGHCTPVVYRTAAGRDQVLLPGSYLLDAYDAQTGERVWWVRGLPGEMKSVPVLLGETLWTHGFASPLNNQGNQIEFPPFEQSLQTMDADGDGRIAAEEIPNKSVQSLFVFFDLDGDKLLDEAEWEGTRASSIRDTTGLHHHAPRSSWPRSSPFRPSQRHDCGPRALQSAISAPAEPHRGPHAPGQTHLPHRPQQGLRHLSRCRT